MVPEGAQQVLHKGYDMEEMFVRVKDLRGQSVVIAKLFGHTFCMMSGG